MKKKYISIILSVLTLVSTSPTISAYASDNSGSYNVNSITTSYAKNSGTTSSAVVKYVEDNGEEAVNIVDLAKELGETIQKEDDYAIIKFENVKKDTSKYVFYLNGKWIQVNNVEIYINGNCTSLPDFRKPKLDGDGYLIPLSMIKNILGDKDGKSDISGVTYEDDGIHIATSVERKSTRPLTEAEKNIAKSKVEEEAKEAELNSYQGVYDYTLVDYIDHYIEENNLGTQPVDLELDKMLEGRMNEEREAEKGYGWKTKNGKFYYLDKGIPKTGWYKDVNTWYYFNKDGTMYTGWLNDNGNWYYFYDSGAMARKVCVNGYYLNEYGAMSNDKPENAPTGISYEELKNRARSIGYSHKSRFDKNIIEEENFSPSYEFRWYGDGNFSEMGYLSIRDDGRCYFSIGGNGHNFNKAISSLIKWMLPTKGDELITKLQTEKPHKETLYMDGRVIEITLYDTGLDLKISDQ